jgi:hypothetical protein
MLGTAMNWMVGLDARPPEVQRLSAQLIGTGTLLLAVLFTLKQTYGTLERIQTIIIGTLLAAILAGLARAPVEWLRVIAGTFSIEWPQYESWVSPQVSKDSVLLTLVVFMGAIGGGPYDYIGYLSFFREKDWGALGLKNPAPADDETPAQPPGATLSYARVAAHPDTFPEIRASDENVRAGRAWLRAPIIDVFTGFGCVLVFTMAFNILGAAILHPQHIVPNGFKLLTPQVEFLTQFGAGFKYIYQVGIFMAFWGTIYGAFEIYSRTAYECARPLVARLRNIPFQRFRLPVCLYAGIGGTVLIWTVEEPLKIVEPAAMIGTATCGLWCWAMIWVDRRGLPGPLRMNRIWVTLNFVAGIVLLVFGGKAIYDKIMGLFAA